MSSKLDKQSYADDPVIQEIHRRMRETKPYQPAPGDPDYLSPEQVERIIRERREEDVFPH